MTDTAATPIAQKCIADMPPYARTWVYKPARDLGQAEQKLVRERGAAFTAGWAAHGSSLDACVDVLHDRFVVIAVDEEQARASGCSIDKSVGFIKQLEHDLNLMLTDRMIVVYEDEGRVKSCRLQQLPDLLRDGVLTADTVVFDDLVSTVGDLRERFRLPLRATWLERYL
jgi:alkanesulfonate monooxygenase SsuD/methylene tetrahydromethanopterin reductase-like flavin-dependent oxidoreductase (luciferase family)